MEVLYMPFINTITNTKISKEQELKIKTRYAQALSIIDKCEAFLMLGFNGETSMYFAGNNSSSMAFVEVKFLGTSTEDTLDKLTGAICQILTEELNIPASKIYVKYEPTQHWGWNGANF